MKNRISRHLHFGKSGFLKAWISDTLDFLKPEFLKTGNSQNLELWNVDVWTIKVSQPIYFCYSGFLICGIFESADSQDLDCWKAGNLNILVCPTVSSWLNCCRLVHFGFELFLILEVSLNSFLFSSRRQRKFRMELFLLNSDFRNNFRDTTVDFGACILLLFLFVRSPSDPPTNPIPNASFQYKHLKQAQGWDWDNQTPSGPDRILGGGELTHWKHTKTKNYLCANSALNIERRFPFYDYDFVLDYHISDFGATFDAPLHFVYAVPPLIPAQTFCTG